MTLEYFPRNHWDPITICTAPWNSGTHPVSCNLSVKDLSQIDPDLYHEIEKYRREIQVLEQQATNKAAERPALKAQADTAETEAAKILELNNELKQIIAGLSDVDFDHLTVEQLARLIQEHPELGTTFNRLKTAVTNLRNTIAQETLTAQNEAQQIINNLQQQFQPAEEVQVNLDFLDVPIETTFAGHEPNIGPAVAEANGTNLFQTACDETLARLNTAQQSGNVAEFFAIFKGWNDFQVRTTQALEKGQGTAATAHALNRSKERVLNFVRTHIDDHGFFQRARIPENVKRIVGNLLQDWDPGLSKDLKEELNTWQDAPNPTQAQVLEAIALLEPVLVKFTDPRLQNENPDPIKESAREVAQIALKQATENLLQAARRAADPQETAGRDEDPNLTLDEAHLVKAKMGMRIALGFADFVLGLTPVGSVKDLIEAMIGVSVVASPGTHLETSERVFLTVTGVLGLATLGSATGASTAIKAAFAGVSKIWSDSKLSKLSLGVSARIVRDAEGIVDSAARIERFHPLNHGPLHAIEAGLGTVADTFRSSSYFEVVTKEPIKLYRVYGGEAGPFGKYWSRIKPTGPLQATLDSALDPSFGNSAKHWVEITVPAGTKFYEGIVSDMYLRMKDSPIQLGNLLGGGSQIYMTERVLESWNIVKGAF